MNICGTHLGMSGDVDEQGRPRCPFCRFELGELLPAAAAPVRPGRCRRPGHELLPRDGCPACAGERAEREGTADQREARVATRLAIAEPNRRRPQ